MVSKSDHYNIINFAERSCDGRREGEGWEGAFCVLVSLGRRCAQRLLPQAISNMVASSVYTGRARFYLPDVSSTAKTFNLKILL